MNQSAKEMLDEIRLGINLAKEISLTGESDWAVYEDKCSIHLIRQLISELTYILDTAQPCYLASTKGSKLVASIDTLEYIASDWLTIEKFFTGEIHLTDEEFDHLLDKMVLVVNIL